MRVVMAIRIDPQKSQQSFGNVPGVFMDQGDRSEAQQQDDHALEQFERGHGAQRRPAAMPLRRPGMLNDRCRHMVHKELRLSAGLQQKLFRAGEYAAADQHGADQRGQP